MSAVELPAPALRSGTSLVPHLAAGEKAPTRKDFASDNEVRWCPGCGDYAILAAVQGFLPSLGLRRENIVCVSGIGCSSRFPYYLDTFGLHSIHGRAPAIATGLAVARPDLSVWVVTGDGDALSIGGNHLIHAMRRNVNLTVLLFNNRIYGLTKGQYSPTSSVGTVTKSTPTGSVDAPFNPVSLALGAEATFVARTMDSDRASLTEVLKAAAAHRGFSFVEIYQNCPIFNDGAYEVLKDRTSAEARLVRLVHGEPVRFGPVGDDGLGSLAVVRTDAGTVEAVPAEQADPARVVVHDARRDDPSVQFALSRLDSPTMTYVPFGVFRQVERPVYDDDVRAQVEAAQGLTADDLAAAHARTGPGAALPARSATDADIDRLLAGSDTWQVG